MSNDTLAEALGALYASTGGAKWHSPWDLAKVSGSRVDMCSLTGIRCEAPNMWSTDLSIDNRNEDGDVYGMDGLQGTLPTELGLVPTLSEVVLIFQPGLSGTIPTELGAVSPCLDLYQSRISGTIPETFAQQERIGILGIAETSISGTLPNQLLAREYGEHFVWFEIRDTKLSGTLPASSSRSAPSVPLGEVLEPLEVDLSRTQLSGTVPTQLAAVLRFHRTKTFRLGSTRLSGTMPSELGVIAGSLQALSLAGTSISGTLPTELGNLVALEAVQLERSHLSGTLPTQLGQLTAMTGEPPPESAGPYAQASHFDLRQTRLSGSLPSELRASRAAYNVEFTSVSVQSLRTPPPPTTTTMSAASASPLQVARSPGPPLTASSIPPLALPLSSPLSSPLTSPFASPSLAPLLGLLPSTSSAALSGHASGPGGERYGGGPEGSSTEGEQHGSWSALVLVMLVAATAAAVLAVRRAKADRERRRAAEIEVEHLVGAGGWPEE